MKLQRELKQPELQTELEGIRHLLSHLHGEVTDLEQSYSQLLLVLRDFQGAANIDDLTGLLRRRAFFRKWQALLDRCRHIEDHCGVILIDIDYFKKVNDTFGHPTGDEVIKNVAQLLKKYESPTCVVGRLGGEEFVLAVQGESAEVAGVAELIRKDVQGMSVAVEDGQCKCTVSLGVASTEKGEFDASRLLKAADEALYEAKNGGRNQVRVMNPQKQ